MSEQPLVVHVVHSLAAGGLENGVVNVVAGTGAHVRHAIICLSTAGPFARRLPPGTPVASLDKRPGNDPRLWVRLVRELRRLRPAVVHTRNWATWDAVPAARLAAVPAVIHGEHGRDVGDPEGRHRRRNLLRRILAPLVTQFVAVSEDLGRWLVSVVGIPAAKVCVIRNGVDLTRFVPGPRDAARRTLGLPRGARVVGTVGRLDPVKDHASLVDAFAELASAFPDAVLAIAGDGPAGPELAARVARLGLGERVRLLGERDDVPRVLRALDVFVLPSVAEGMSNTLLEAMATGLPVVATRVGGNPELVDDGVTGLLVPRRAPRALAAAIARYLDDPHLAALHGKAGRQRAEERFALPVMCEAYARLYRDLAARSRG